jgi:predicted MFS family arabinose efflux permease
MWIMADNFPAVFWFAVIPAFLSVGLLVLAVPEPERPTGLRKIRSPLSFSELKRLGIAYWWVVGVAVVFSIARFSEAFLILRAQAVGLPVALVPMVLVVMNVVYALAAYPAGALSDSANRIAVLAFGFGILIVADLVLALTSGLAGVALGVSLWGLHMGFTQRLLATLVADTSPPELRGTAYGIFNLLVGLALLVASILAGALWDSIGSSGTFLAGALFTAFAMAGLALTHRVAPQAGQAPKR